MPVYNILDHQFLYREFEVVQKLASLAVTAPVQGVRVKIRCGRIALHIPSCKVQSQGHAPPPHTSERHEARVAAVRRHGPRRRLQAPRAEASE